MQISLLFIFNLSWPTPLFYFFIQTIAKNDKLVMLQVQKKKKSKAMQYTFYTLIGENIEN